jgi:hypothetical protein
MKRLPASFPRARASICCWKVTSSSPAPASRWIWCRRGNLWRNGGYRRDAAQRHGHRTQELPRPVAGRKIFPAIAQQMPEFALMLMSVMAQRLRRGLARLATANKPSVEALDHAATWTRKCSPTSSCARGSDAIGGVGGQGGGNQGGGGCLHVRRHRRAHRDFRRRQGDRACRPRRHLRRNGAGWTSRDVRRRRPPKPTAPGC